MPTSLPETRRLGPGRYLLDGQRVPSVTTIVGTTPKPGLPYWYAKQVAELAVRERSALAELDDDAAFEYLRGAPTRAMNRAAGRGTKIHELAEGLQAGREVEVPDAMVRHVEACARFLDDFDAVPVLTEEPVFSRSHAYAGELDAVLMLRKLGQSMLVDWKTGGVWPESALQLTGYRFAEFFVRGDVEEPMPEVDGCAVVALSEEGYELRPVVANRSTFAVFLALRVVRVALDDAADSWVGPRLLPPDHRAKLVSA